MPNTFGTSQIQVKLVDPRDARLYRKRFRRDAIPELDLANSLYVPIGRNPARGWILLVRSDYDMVRGYDTDFQLSFADVKSKTGLTFKNLSIVQARSVTTGLSDDPDAIYLVELTDGRGVLANQWFQKPTNSYFNVLSPAYPSLYYADSLNAGVSYTWSTMISNLWLQMSYLGAYPGLPSVPSGTPTNWILDGVSAFDALNQMLTHIGMGISVDPTEDAPYGIVSLGDTDQVFNGLTTQYAGVLEDDLEWIDVGAGRVPGTVIVYFRRVNEQYGTEETIRRDGPSWAMNASYSVSVTAPATFADAVGVHGMWDDFPVRYDVNNTPLPADVATAAAIAAERVQQYYNVIYSRTSGYMNRTYTGVLPFYAGSQVDGVCWRQDFRDQNREGWRTQIMRGDVWREVYPDAEH